jgi:hypothetical protein
MKNLQLDRKTLYRENETKHSKTSKVNTARTAVSRPKTPQQSQRPASSPGKRPSSAPRSHSPSVYSTPRSGIPASISYEQHKNYYIPTPVRHHSNHDFYTGPETPGPGQYHPKEHAIRPISPSHSIQKARRFDYGSTTSRSSGVYSVSGGQYTTPGPGNYSPATKEEIHNPLGWRNSFSKDKRFHENSASTGVYSRPVSPGPNAYRPNYDLQSNLLTTSGRSFGKDKRKGVYDPSSANSPGPGSYNTPINHSPSKIRRSPSATFGTSSRVDLEDSFGRSASPGPGGYEVTSKHMNANPSYSFSKSKKDDYVSRSRPVSPGPNAYRPNFEVARKSASGPTTFTKDKRDRMPSERSHTPSVFDYSPVHKHNNPSYSFSRSQSPTRKESVSPGPSYYNPKADTVNSGTPAYSFSQSTNRSTSSRSKSPGPDQYDIARSYNYINGPKTGSSFGTSKRASQSRSSSPGPGQYSHTTEVRTRKGGVTIPKDKRFNYDRSSSPGPGQYRVESSYHSLNRPMSPSFTKQKRSTLNSHSSNSTPGPADYYPSTNYSRPKSPAAVMYLTG